MTPHGVFIHIKSLTIEEALLPALRTSDTIPGFRQRKTNVSSGKSWADFMRLADQFKAEPTLENYLVHRRAFGGSGVDSAHLIATDPISSIESELRQYDIDPSIFSDVLDGNDHQIDELCLRLMEKLVERQALEESGKSHVQTTGKAIPDSLIDYLAISMLEACEAHDLSPPPALVVLIRERLGGPNPARHKQNLIDKNRKQAIWMAAQRRLSGKSISVRQIAKKMGLEASTVSRWFKLGELEHEAERMRKWFKKPNDLVRKAKR